MFQSSKYLVLIFIFLMTHFSAEAGTATRMRRKRTVSVAVTLSWSSNPSTWNFTGGQNSYTLTNTGTNPATGLSFSLNVFAGTGSPIPNNLGDPYVAGDYLYISTHNCGTSLGVGASCTVVIDHSPFIANPVYTSCTATSGSNNFTLTNLFWDNNI